MNNNYTLKIHTQYIHTSQLLPALCRVHKVHIAHHRSHQQGDGQNSVLAHAVATTAATAIVVSTTTTVINFLYIECKKMKPG